MKPEDVQNLTVGELDCESWLYLGWLNGWASAPTCTDHDGVAMSEDEEIESEEYGEVCVSVVRLYESDLQKKQVERNCPPAVWRGSNRGWTR